MKRIRRWLSAVLSLSVISLGVVLSGRLLQSAASRKVQAISTQLAGFGAPELSEGLSASGRISPNQTRLVENYGKLPLSFETNGGQTDWQVKFLSRSKGYALFLTCDEAVLALRRTQEPGIKGLDADRTHLTSRASPLRTFGPLLEEPHSPKTDSFNPVAGIHNSSFPALQSASTSFLRLRLVGANPKVNVVGLEELPGKVNYFIGNDPRKWRTNVATFAKVKYKNVYPGVDLVYYGNQGQLEYDFVVAPGADPKAIALAVEAGLSRHEPAGDVKPLLRIAADGDLVIQAGEGEVRFHRPVAYQLSASAQPQSRAPVLQIQNRRFVYGHYVLTTGNHVRFEVPSYDKSQPLVIDPVLSYSTYLGGNGADVGYSIAVDSTGSAYITGFTTSTDFPTANPLQASNASGQDAFVTKLNAAGSALVYSTYLGGSVASIEPTAWDWSFWLADNFVAE